MVSTRRQFLTRSGLALFAVAGGAALYGLPAGSQPAPTRIQQMRMLAASIRVRTASNNATWQFAQDLRANRDAALKALVGNQFAGRLIEMPLDFRRTIGNELYYLVGNPARPPLQWSQISHIRNELPLIMSGLVISVLDLFGNQSSSSLPQDHPCHLAERQMDFAYGQAIQAHDAWVACRTGVDDEGGGSVPAGEGGIAIFQTSPSEGPSGNPPAPAESECDDLWEQYKDAGDTWRRLAEAYNNCMAANPS